jgi:hypothetical protein
MYRNKNVIYNICTNPMAPSTLDITPLNNGHVHVIVHGENGYLKDEHGQSQIDDDDYC